MPPGRRGGVRSSSRKNTPVSPPKPVAVAPPQQAATRRSARGRSKDAESGESIRAQPRATRDAAQPDKSVLSTVDEIDGDPVDLEETGISLSDAGSGSEGGLTVQTTFSQFVNSNLSRDDMIDALPELLDDSSALISLLIGKDAGALMALHESLISPSESRFKGRFHSKMESYGLSRQPFETTGASFINLHTAICKLANVRSWDQVPTGTWRPDAILQLANATGLVATLFPSRRLDDEAGAFLENLHNVFPAPFFADYDLAAGMISGSAHILATIALGLGIRTQFCIRALQKEYGKPEFDPDYTLRAFFFNEDGMLRPLDLNEEAAELDERWQRMFNERIQAIREHFSTDGNDVNFETLEMTFGWADFLVQVFQWAALRIQELTRYIEKHGGAPNMQKHLRGDPTAASYARKSHKKRMSAAEKRRRIDQQIVALEAAKAAKKAAGSSTTQTARPEDGVFEEPRAGFDEVQEPPVRGRSLVLNVGHEDQMIDPSLRPTQQTEQVMRTLRMHEMQSNKENIDSARKGKAAFTDRQPGAQRIEFDEAEASQGTPGPSRKRQRQAQVNEVEDEEGFEEDSRPQPAKRARTSRIHDRDDHLTGEIQDSQEQEGSDLYRQLSHASTQPQAAPQERRILTPYRSRLPPSSAPARTRIRVPTSPVPGTPGRQFGGRGPQVRIPFSAAENTRLLELIESVGRGARGISWAALEKEDLHHPDGPLLQRRGQVGLKDKARNMKMDFYKARQPLPPNFDLVPLGNRMIDMLDRAGIPHTER